MCDTMVALTTTTADGSVLFAKNSDRDPNEVHELVLVPSKNHNTKKVKCTYIEIPQVQHTHAVFLSRPFWIWGAEMGVNEHGVVIGNEAVFSKIPAGKKPGLIGMDYLRLALERGASAEESAQVIIDLLEEFGQSGNCGYEKPLYYHNSYLIADLHSAYILETVGKEWALKQVKRIGTISNRISIQHDYDRCSNNLVQQAIDRKWCKSEETFNFQKYYSDVLYTQMADGERRSCETFTALDQANNSVTEETLFAILRNHRNGFPSSRSLTGADVCMHAGYGLVRGSQTTGSMVARITEKGTTIWVTGTSAPCMSIFKPIWLESGLPESAQVKSTAQFSSEQLWWQHEILHRAMLKDPKQYLPMIKKEQLETETDFIQQARSIQDSNAIKDKKKLSEDCFSEAAQLTNKWINRVEQTEPKNIPSLLYRRAWQKRNERVNFPLRKTNKVKTSP